jgi:phage terminase large subunit
MTKVATTYYHVKNSKKRFCVNQGGTRSAKTYSILQVLIEFCWLNNNSGQIISIVRKTSPALKGTVYRDFFEILEKEGWYDPNLHNKTDKTYILFGNLIEFIAVDEGQKIRGRKRDIAYLNEANELTTDDFDQINFRTRLKIIIDYNPSFLEHEWIDPLIERKSVTDFYITTYRDNPFLPDDQVREIEAIKSQNHNKWKIYGLGQRAVVEGLIYTNWDTYSTLPNINNMDTVYGLDFGYSNQMALVQVWFKERDVYVKLLFYKSNHTTNDLIEFAQSTQLSKSTYLFCDSAERDRIEELKRVGFLAKKSDKKVWSGINFVQSLNLHIHEDSYELIKEIKSYQRKEKDGKFLDEPIKMNDHACDAMRYAIYTHYFKQLTPNKSSAGFIDRSEYSHYQSIVRRPSSFV